MYIAQCIFRRKDGSITRPYSYEINEQQMEELEPSDYVVVTSARGDYTVAQVNRTIKTEDKELMAIVTQHVACKIVDHFYDKPKAVIYGDDQEYDTLEGGNA